MRPFASPFIMPYMVSSVAPVSPLDAGMDERSGDFFIKTQEGAPVLTEEGQLVLLEAA